MEHKRKRLNFSIKKKMQIRLLIKVLGIVIVGVGLMAAVFYFYSDREINSSYRQFHIHADNFLELLQPAVITSLVLALVVSVIITLFLPIKIAGPAFRIERTLRENVVNGDLTVRFTLRKGDELGELADALNKCLENTAQKIAAAQKMAEDLESCISDKSHPDNKNIEGIAMKLNEQLKQFKV
jgi:methyl-accepting chemotaxis protein